MIVPNGDFISQTVTNWSHGDPKVRIRIPIGVAYGTDTALVERLLLEVAAENKKTLKDPEPSVFLRPLAKARWILNWRCGPRKWPRVPAGSSAITTSLSTRNIASTRLKFRFLNGICTCVPVGLKLKKLRTPRNPQLFKLLPSLCLGPFLAGRFLGLRFPIAGF